MDYDALRAGRKSVWNKSYQETNYLFIHCCFYKPFWKLTLCWSFMRWRWWDKWSMNTEKGKGKRRGKGRPATKGLSRLSLAGLLLLLVLPGLFTWALTPAWYNITGRRRRQRQSPSHCGFGWFCFRLIKKSSSLFSPWSQSATASRWGGSFSCHFFSSPQAFWLMSFKGKIRWCNCVSVTAQSSSLNEIDERSGSRCYHKVP